MRAHSLRAVLFAGLLLACETEPLMNEPPAKIVVYGRVFAANGAAVPRALMSLTARADGSCAGPLVDAGNAFTSASGDYRAALYSSTRLLAPTTAASETRPTVCVRVTASPVEGSGFRASSAQLAPVAMRRDALDSVRVDVELEPNP